MHCTWEDAITINADSISDRDSLDVTELGSFCSANRITELEPDSQPELISFCSTDHQSVFEPKCEPIYLSLELSD